MGLAMRLAVVGGALAGCASTGAQHAVVTLRPACTTGTYWTGHACAPAGDAPKQLDAGAQAIAAQDVDAIKASVDAAAKAGPLDYSSNIRLWEERGIGLAYGDDDRGAKTAFDMMLALDPRPRAELPALAEGDARVREGPQGRPHRRPRSTSTGRVARRSAIRYRSTSRWSPIRRSSSIARRCTCAPAGRPRGTRPTSRSRQLETIVLPPIIADKPVSLELYLRAYDGHDNEVLTWADPQHPREVALRYEPPTPWYRKWWVWALGGSAVALATGVTVYELTIAPPDTVGGTATVAK